MHIKYSRIIFINQLNIKLKSSISTSISSPVVLRYYMCHISFTSLSLSHENFSFLLTNCSMICLDSRSFFFFFFSPICFLCCLSTMYPLQSTGSTKIMPQTLLQFHTIIIFCLTFYIYFYCNVNIGEYLITMYLVIFVIIQVFNLSISICYLYYNQATLFCVRRKHRYLSRHSINCNWLVHAFL